MMKRVARTLQTHRVASSVPQAGGAPEDRQLLDRRQISKVMQTKRTSHWTLKNMIILHSWIVFVPYV